MLFLLLALPGFSELMPDPVGADNNLEFVEVAWNESLANLTFVLADADSNDTATPVTTVGNGSVEYLLFVEEGWNITALNMTNTSCAVFSVGPTIGNNLGNANDTLHLFVRGENYSRNFSTAYEVLGCAAGEGCSLSNNGAWVPTVATPCAPNVFPSINSTNQTNNETAPSCAFNFSIAVNRLYDEGEAIVYRPVFEPKPDNFTITYWWEDLYGVVVKEARETTNADDKRYTPKQGDERDWALLVKMRAQTCNETVLFAEELVVVKGDEVPEQECPVCESKSCPSLPPQAPQQVLRAAIASSVIAGETLHVLATIHNDQFVKQEFAVAAYAYRGSKNYTSKEPRNVTVAPSSEKDVEFSLIIDEPGEYLVKVSAVRAGRKTPYEERRTLRVLERAEQSVTVQAVNQSVQATPDVEEVSPLLPITGSVVASEQKSYTGFWLSGIIAAGLFAFSRLRNVAGAD